MATATQVPVEVYFSNMFDVTGTIQQLPDTACFIDWSKVLELLD